MTAAAPPSEAARSGPTTRSRSARALRFGDLPSSSNATGSPEAATVRATIKSEYVEAVVKDEPEIYPVHAPAAVHHVKEDEETKYAESAP